ncbi:NAD-dependent epimerase/dehydratase family protein, partial [bacterium]|nr:NAD-dependent epimerase/dehydratase family protein [bacterium]
MLDKSKSLISPVVVQVYFAAILGKNIFSFNALAGDNPATDLKRPLDWGNVFISLGFSISTKYFKYTFASLRILGTQNLLEVAKKHKVKKFIQISTDEVYGSIENGSWDENFSLEPNSPYAASKACADLLCLAYNKTYGLPVLITRCSNNYGP